MEKYFKYLESQGKKIKKELDEKEKREAILCTLFEYTIPKVFRNTESLQKKFEFRNERKTFGDDFAEFKADVIYNIEYDQKDENGEPIIEERHIYTLTIKITDDYINFENMTLILESEFGAEEFKTDYLTINEKGFEDALSEVFIRMDKIEERHNSKE